jgi:hypothetical protein
MKHKTLPGDIKVRKQPPAHSRAMRHEDKRRAARDEPILDDEDGLPPACECDNTHQANDTVCRWCWAHGRRHWNDPEVKGQS